MEELRYCEHLTMILKRARGKHEYSILILINGHFLQIRKALSISVYREKWTCCLRNIQRFGEGKFVDSQPARKAAIPEMSERMSDQRSFL